METSQESQPAASILIVEDDLVAGEIIRRMIELQFPGTVTYSAGNGIDGEELFKEHKPAVVITDISMWGKNGVEMAREIKALAPATKFVVLTAYGNSIFLEQFKEIGFHAYLLKPIDVDKFMTALAECIAEVEQRR